MGKNIDEEKLRRILAGELPPGKLNDEEEAVWRKRMVELLDEPTPEEEVFFAELAAHADAPGLADGGELFPGVMPSYPNKE